MSGVGAAQHGHGFLAVGRPLSLCLHLLLSDWPHVMRAWLLEPPAGRACMQVKTSALAWEGCKGLLKGVDSRVSGWGRLRSCECQDLPSCRVVRPCARSCLEACVPCGSEPHRIC